MKESIGVNKSPCKNCKNMDFCKYVNDVDSWVSKINADQPQVVSVNITCKHYIKTDNQSNNAASIMAHGIRI